MFKHGACKTGSGNGRASLLAAIEILAHVYNSVKPKYG